MDKFKRLKVKTWNLVVVLALGVCLLIYVLFLSSTREAEFKRHLKERNEVVDLITSGNLKPSEHDAVNLPDKYQGLTVFGKVYVSGEKGNLRINFPISKMKSDFEVFVFMESGDVPKVKYVNGRIVQADNWNVPVHKLQEHWFYANSMEMPEHYAKTN